MLLLNNCAATNADTRYSLYWDFIKYKYIKLCQTENHNYLYFSSGPKNIGNILGWKGESEPHSKRILSCKNHELEEILINVYQTINLFA